MGRIPIASVHGRFQPPHLEHLEYILTAFQEADYLFVGITQFRRAHLEQIEGANPHRNMRESNPLTYYERSELLSIALRDRGIGPDRYRIIPFPIERPSELTDYLPTSVPIFSTRVDDWNDRKAELLRSQGYTVRILFNRDSKNISGSDIRRLIAAGDDEWTRLVPTSTVSYLKSLDLADRIRDAS